MSTNNGTTAIRELAQRLLAMDEAAMPAAEKRLIERLAKRLAVSRNIGKELEEGRTFGQRLADQVAAIGGSWGFIIAFLAFVALWALLNVWALFAVRMHPFDPYPFIFLNLMLSLLAALQAPVIMMSQNRQAAKDRLMAANDYEVNLKAEIEIAALHEKLDAIRAQELATLMQRVENAVTEKKA
jgi:uncharacterized membrane protein